MTKIYSWQAASAIEDDALLLVSLQELHTTDGLAFILGVCWTVYIWLITNLPARILFTATTN